MANIHGIGGRKRIIDNNVAKNIYDDYVIAKKPAYEVMSVHKISESTLRRVIKRFLEEKKES